MGSPDSKYQAITVQDRRRIEPDACASENTSLTGIAPVLLTDLRHLQHNYKDSGSRSSIQNNVVMSETIFCKWPAARDKTPIKSWQGIADKLMQPMEKA
jgi:hypothetical protein